MKDKFEEVIRKYIESFIDLPYSYKTFSEDLATDINTLHQKALKEVEEKREKLIGKFWKKSSKLIDLHRKNDNEKNAQGVVDCRILINKLSKQL